MAADFGEMNSSNLQVTISSLGTPTDLGDLKDFFATLLYFCASYYIM